MAAMLRAMRIPSIAPPAAASITFAWSPRPAATTTPAVADRAVSGSRIFATYRAHGAAITLVASSATGSAPRVR